MEGKTVIELLLYYIPLIFFLFAFSQCSLAQTITSPEEFIGHPVGADYKLASWDTIVRYFSHVAENSDRVQVRQIATTTEGRPYIVAEISSAETIRNIGSHMQNRRKIADPRLIENEEEECRLIGDSKVVVYFGCGIHGNEVGASQMSLELLYELAAGDSPEIDEILDRIILVMIPSCNPDGFENVREWYAKTIGKPWEGDGMPWLYSKYAGNQNVWDTVHLNLPESRADAQVLYQEWFPNILCDIHQWGSTSARLLVPPHGDPTNPNVHPMHNQMLLLIGGFMQTELLKANKKGVIARDVYSTYESGIPRYTAARHNIVGLLTEAASVRVATPVFLNKDQLNPRHTEVTTDMPDPWPGGWWRLRDIIDYEKIAYMGVLKGAARNHELFQQFCIKAGRDAIEKGKTEPPFAFLVPLEQHDPGTAAHMMELLHFSGVEIYQAEEPFIADDVKYSPGTYILYCAQPYRPYVKDLMERQDPPTGPQPNRFEGWTLPLQMGVKRVAVNKPFTCAVKKLDSIPMPEGGIVGDKNAVSYLVNIRSNDDYRLINRLHGNNIRFGIITSGKNWKQKTGVDVQNGSLYIRDGKKLQGKIPEILDGVSSVLAGTGETYSEIKSLLCDVTAPRTGVYAPWTENLNEGWTRFVLDTFEFAYTTVRNAEIIAGNLRERFDCIILPSESSGFFLNGNSPDSTDTSYTGGIGPDGVVSLQKFVREGGTLVCIDEACNFPIDHFNIPVQNILRGKKQDEFFCRGSSLRISVDTNHPVGYGMPEWASAYFYEAQAFDIIKPEGKNREKPEENKVLFPCSVVARYAETALVETGTIRAGDDLIKGKPAIVEVEYGDGHIVLLGFRVNRNAQTWGSFRFLFNAIQRSTLKE
ncbi:MAG: peptidase M14 [Candidatus Latescibacteria bacterium]|nr:peptidase M14 [Candidatus Latescibacterota bacterium]